MSDYQIKNPVQMTKDVESFVPGVGPIVDGKLTNAPENLEGASLTKMEGQQPSQPAAPVAPAASIPQPANPAPVAAAAPVQPVQQTANQETN